MSEPDEPEEGGAEREREDAEWQQLQREANAIDPYRYRRRNRILAAIGTGALGAGIVWAVLVMTEAARNPCQRLRNHYCKQDPRSMNCGSYDGLFIDSQQDPSAKMRSLVKLQCQTKIRRLQEEDGIKVP
jgi:hypothetical protein